MWAMEEDIAFVDLDQDGGDDRDEEAAPDQAEQTSVLCVGSVSHSFDTQK